MIYAKMVAQRRYYILSFHDCFVVYFDSDSEMEVIYISLVTLLCLVVLSYLGSCNLMFIILVFDMLVGFHNVSFYIFTICFS